VTEDDGAGTLEAGIRNYLLTCDPVCAITKRFYAWTRPQNSDSLPDVLIQRTATLFQQTTCGTDGLVSGQMQIDSYAMNGLVAVRLAQALKAALDGFSTGMMGDTYVDRVFIDNEFAAGDPDPGIARMTQLYTFWFKEDST
jgi:hypothetical protein